LCTSFSLPSWSQQWVLLGCLWTSSEVNFYVNNVLTYSNTLSTTGNDIPTSPMQIQWDFALGAGGLNPNSSTPSPAYYNIDWVRVWQSVSSAPTQFTLTGTGSGTLRVQSQPFAVFLNGPAGSGGVTLTLSSSLTGNTDTFQA